MPPVADTMIGEALDLLEKARRPLILVGPAMGRRRAEIAPFTEFTHIPALVMESPRGTSDPSLRAAASCLREADVVLLLGKRLDFSLRFGQSPPFSPDCRFIRVDAEGTRPHDHVALEIAGDPSIVLRQLGKAARQRVWPGGSWAAQVETARRSVPADWVELRRSSRLPIHPLRVCASLRPHLGANTILVSDGGEFGQWIQAGTEAVEGIINGPSGAIGGSLPMALGAKLARPDSQIIVALGDGAFGFHALEFDTAVRYRLPFLAIVGNDARWNAEYRLQVQRYGVDRAVGCALQRSRYDKLAEALGGYGELVERPEDIAAALDRGVRSGLPACVNVTIDAVPAPVFDVT